MELCAFFFSLATSLFFIPSQNWRLLFYPSGVPAWEPNGRWRVCRVHCALCRRKESDEPGTDVQGHVGGLTFALCIGTENTWQRVHRSGRKIHWMVSGYASVWLLIAGRILCRVFLFKCWWWFGEVIIFTGLRFWSSTRQQWDEAETAFSDFHTLGPSSKKYNFQPPKTLDNMQLLLKKKWTNDQRCLLLLLQIL